MPKLNLQKKIASPTEGACTISVAVTMPGLGLMHEGVKSIAGRKNCLRFFNCFDHPQCTLYNLWCKPAWQDTVKLQCFHPSF